jgi:hypothetical protein
MVSTVMSTLDRGGHGAIDLGASVLGALMRINPFQDAENSAPSRKPSFNN